LLRANIKEARAIDAERPVHLAFIGQARASPSPTAATPGVVMSRP
jgi:hypothetical protein